MEKGVRGTCEGSLMAAPEAVGDRGVVEGQGWGERNREAERIETGRGILCLWASLSPQTQPRDPSPLQEEPWGSL